MKRILKVVLKGTRRRSYLVVSGNFEAFIETMRTTLFLLKPQILPAKKKGNIDGESNWR